jgi:hypothetical protein
LATFLLAIFCFLSIMVTAGICHYLGYFIVTHN